MLNKQPIFLNAFGRGGSNMLVNLILTHPDVCISSGETHKVFKGRARFDTKWDTFKKNLVYDIPIRFKVGQNIFDPRLLQPRKKVPDSTKRYIDKILYHGRFKAKVETHNLYKYQNVNYTDEELAECRLLTKGLNGMVFNAKFFSEMYPDATFFALVRNGLAICEGMTRRGVDAKKVALSYKLIVEEMTKNAEEIPNYHILTYEEMVTNPLQLAKNLYQQCDLDFSKVQKIRLESKATMDSKGNRELNKGYDRQVFWYDQNDLHQHIRSDINENQIKQLSSANRDIFLSIAKGSMETMGYET